MARWMDGCTPHTLSIFLPPSIYLYMSRLDGVVLRLRRVRCLPQRLLEAADLGREGGRDAIGPGTGAGMRTVG